MYEFRQPILLTDIGILAFPDLSGKYDGLSLFKEKQDLLEDAWDRAAIRISNNPGGALFYHSNLPTDPDSREEFSGLVAVEDDRIDFFTEILGNRFILFDERDEVNFSAKLPAILIARGLDWDCNTSICAFGKFYDTWVNNFLQRTGRILGIPESNRYRLSRLSLRSPDA